MNKNSMLHSMVVVSLTLMMTMLPLSTLICASAQKQAEVSQPQQRTWVTKYPWTTQSYDPQHTGFSPSPGPKTNHTLWIAEGTTSGGAIADGKVFFTTSPYSSYGTTANPGTYALDARTGELVWRREIGMGFPVIDLYTNSIFVVNSTKVFSLDVGTGGTKWSYDVASIGFNASDDWPAYLTQVSGPGGGLIYAVTTGNHPYVYAFTTTPETTPNVPLGTGTLVWYYKLPDTYHYGVFVSGAMYYDNRLYVQTYNGIVTVLNANNGDFLWQHQTFGIAGARYRVSAANGIVYMSSDDSYEYALNASTGDEIWKFKTGAGLGEAGTIAYGKVYIHGYDGGVYALNALTGTLVWNHTFPGAYLWPSWYVADGLVYGIIPAGPPDAGTVYALDAETGATVWTYQFMQVREGRGAPSGFPAIADGILYVGGGNYFYAIGRGPTTTAVSVTASYLDLGKSTIISGSVMDQSPYTLQRPDLQSPQVANVPVDVYAGMTKIATVTTDSMGGFSYEWTPTAEGTYDVYASFAGDDSYEPSMESVKVQVGPEPPDVPSAEEIAEEVDVPTVDEVADEVVDRLPEYSTMDLIIVIVVVVAVLIGVYNTYAIRKIGK